MGEFTLTRGQQQALECFLPNQKYGPCTPSRGACRYKASLRRLGLLASDLCTDNYGAPFPLFYLTEAGVAARAAISKATGSTLTGRSS